MATGSDRNSPGINPGPLLFNIFINDLSHVIDFTRLSTYADDTQIFYAGDNVTDLEHAINSDLSKMHGMTEENEMRRNHDKYKAMVMERYHATLFSNAKVQVFLW